MQKQIFFFIPTKLHPFADVQFELFSSVKGFEFLK